MLKIFNYVYRSADLHLLLDNFNAVDELTSNMGKYLQHRRMFEVSSSTALK